MEMPLIILLAGVTFIVVLALVIWSKRATDKRMEEHPEPKSTLAKDKDSHGKPADVK